MAVSCEMLLYPELLSNEQLITIIQQRHLRVNNIERMDRCELLDIFKNYCVPYGQRKYRDSGRGKVLNKARPASPESAPKLKTINNNASRKHLNMNSDRLKPPPDSLSCHMKRIKLESVQCKDVNITCKRKMSVDMISTLTESPATKKERKPITWP